MRRAGQHAAGETVFRDRPPHPSPHTGGFWGIGALDWHKVGINEKWKLMCASTLERRLEAEVKTIVAGDLHLKQEHVLPLVDAAVERVGAERVILCGDYTDEWGASNADELEALALMVAWASERRRSGIQVDLLMGNHDFAYFTGRGNSGTRRGIGPEVVRLLREAGVTMATAVGDILLTHAGLTSSWAERRLGPRAWNIQAESPQADGAPETGDRAHAGEPEAAACGEAGAMPSDETAPTNGEVAGTNEAAQTPEAPEPPLAGQLARALNDIYESEDRTRWADLDEAGRARGGWGLPGPLWADATELAADPLPGLRQIVGHTPMSTCARLLDDERHPELPELWVCDTFSTYRSGSPIGDGALLLIDTEPVPAAETVDGLVPEVDTAGEPVSPESEGRMPLEAAPAFSAAHPRISVVPTHDLSPVRNAGAAE